MNEKTLLYWFSGTGNSLAVAKTLRDGLGNTDLIPLAQADPRMIPPAQRIGFILPVYAGGIPLIVKRFLRQFTPSPNTPIFAVVTYGGIAGISLTIIRNLLRQQGLTLNASFGIRMVDNYPPFGGAPTEQKQHIRLKQSQSIIQHIITSLQTPGYNGHAHSLFLWKILSSISYPFFCHFLPRMDKKFFTDSKCNSCGICAQVCPVKNITLVGKKPQWQGHCEQCYACFHFCPQKAIQYGNRTTKQTRYHHPDITVNDIILKK